MRNDAKLVDLGANVRSIRRTRIGKTTFELKCDITRKSTTFTCLARKVLAVGVEMSLQMAAAAAQLHKDPASNGTGGLGSAICGG